MKSLKLIAIAAILMISCKNDDNVSRLSSDKSSAALEERAIQPNKVIAGTLIDINKNSGIRVTKIKASDIPTPSDKIKIHLPKDKQTAFQDAGFELKVKGSQNFDGVYIQAKDQNGNTTEDIIKVEFNNSVNTSTKKPSNFRLLSTKLPISKKISKTTNNSEGTKTIDIDFTGLEPGRFCYTICVYVNNPNGVGGQLVSQPSDLCVEIESWGGKSEIVGNWNFEQVQTTETNLLTNETKKIVHKNGEPFKITVYNCNTEEFEKVEHIETVNTFQLNNDGSFVSEENEIALFYKKFKIINLFNNSTEGNDCSKNLIKHEYKRTFKGNWAYSEEKNELTLVAFYGKETLTIDNQTQSFEDNISEIFLEHANVVLNGNMLQLNTSERVR